MNVVTVTHDEIECDDVAIPDYATDAVSLIFDEVINHSDREATFAPELEYKVNVYLREQYRLGRMPALYGTVIVDFDTNDIYCSYRYAQ